jgi:integrase/recombinase XerD
MNFKEYLEQKNLASSNINRIEKHIKTWLAWYKNEVENSTYKDLMNYIEILQKQEKSIHHINRVLLSISHYYEYENLPNVALTVRLKGSKTKAMAQPIKKEELDLIYHNTKTDEVEKIILGLMIYQGIERGDLMTIETKDIYLAKGEIYIPSRKERNSRVISLEPRQILPLQQFIQNKNKSTELLFSPYNDSYDHLQYLLSKLWQKIKETVLNHQIYITKLSHLRQSKIAIWTKEEGIRKAQYKAGFKRVLSAEKYRIADMEGLKEALKKYHPLK